MKTIWNKQTGESAEYESVDAREILNNSPDIYTDTDPKGADPADPDGDGFEGGPQNVANVENEFRREPVGDDVPAAERDVAIIRNPVTDQPKMAPDPLDHDANGQPGGAIRTDGPTVAEFVAAGYPAKNYPPAGYASRSTPEEVATAVDAEKAKSDETAAQLKAKIDDMTVDQLKAHAAANNIDLGDATLKADIRAAIDLANGQ